MSNLGKQKTLKKVQSILTRKIIGKKSTKILDYTKLKDLNVAFADYKEIYNTIKFFWKRLSTPTTKDHTSKFPLCKCKE